MNTKQSMWTAVDVNRVKRLIDAFWAEHPDAQRIDAVGIVAQMERSYPKTHAAFVACSGYPILNHNLRAAAHPSSLCIHCGKFFATVHLCPNCTSLAEARMKSKEMKRIRTVMTNMERYGSPNVMGSPDVQSVS